MTTYLSSSKQKVFATPHFKSIQTDESIVKSKIRIGDIPSSTLFDIADSTLISGNIDASCAINILSASDSDNLNGTGTSLFGNYKNTNVDVTLGSCLINGTFEDVIINSNGIGNNIGGLFKQTTINTASTSHIFGSTNSDCLIQASDDLSIINCIGNRGHFITQGKLSIINAIGTGSENSDCIITSAGDLSNIFGISDNGGSIVNTGDTSLILTKIDSDTNDELTLNAGDMSLVMGRHLTNANENCLFLGQYGEANFDTNNGGDIVLGNNSIQLCGGVDIDATTSNTVMIGTSALSNSGAVGGGIADFWNVAGADYAEYFEWSDMNKSSEDRSGYFVDIKNNDQISIAEDEPYDVVGITTSSLNSTSGYTGDCAQFHWKGANQCDNLGRVKTKMTIGKNLRDIITSNHYKYDYELKEIIEKEEGNPNIKLDLLSVLRNQYKMKKRLLDHDLTKALINVNGYSKTDIDFRRTEMENSYKKLIDQINKCKPNKVIICNPKHDSERKYIPRSQRPEWIPVGMLGKLHVFDNGECKVGKRCKNLNGIAVPDEDNKGWRVLERISKTTIRILFK